MPFGSLFKTTTNFDDPLNGSVNTVSVVAAATTSVSDFITVQSFTNFAAMTGAITAAWKALQTLDPLFNSLRVPYAFAAAFGLVSLIMSADGLRKPGPPRKIDWTKTGPAIFISVINVLVLAGAVVGTAVVTTPGP